MVQLSDVRYVLMDVEGTTSDIHFVKEVLFPYSAREMRNFVSGKRTNPTVRDCLRQTGRPDDESAIEQLLTWIRQDVKHPALKTLQGMIWEKGFREGAFKAHIYPEVVACWNNWRAQGLRLGIYSSGSVAAQKLFFGYNQAGDLTGYLENYFDLEMGGKREAASYKKIAEALKLEPRHIVFLSDVPEELAAATEAGFQAVHVVRPGTQEQAGLARIKSFDELAFS